MNKVLLTTLIFLAASLSAAQRHATVPGADLVVRKRSSLWRERSCDYDRDRRAFDCSYLRFYADGTVIGVTSEGNPNEIKKWFRRPYNSTGIYKIDGSKMTFSLTSPEGTVDYDGRISGNVLRLNIHSHINGYRGTNEYIWIRPRRC